MTHHNQTKKRTTWFLRKELEFIVESVVTAKGVANRAKVNQLDASQGSEVSVINEFPDVFPEELLGMLPD
jgi:hypothetical protein